MLKKSERVLVSWGSEAQGPLICFLAGIHGNEPAGILALERVFIQLKQLDPPFHGRFIGLMGNIPALSQQQRYVDTDLNRLWSRVEVERILGLEASQRNVEEQELVELVAYLQAVREAPFHPQFYVDLHTTSAFGGAFSIVGHQATHRALAECLPVPMIFGLTESLAQTTNRYFEEHGMIGMAFESGQHDDPGSVDRHEAAIWLLLASVGCLRSADVPRWEDHLQVLRDVSQGLSHYQQVIHRHEVEEGSEFSMIPGFTNFQPVSLGQPIAFDLRGEIFSPVDGRMLMPLYQSQGKDGFFIIEDLDTPPV